MVTKFWWQGVTSVHQSEVPPEGWAGPLPEFTWPWTTIRNYRRVHQGVSFCPSHPVTINETHVTYYYLKLMFYSDILSFSWMYCFYSILSHLGYHIISCSDISLAPLGYDTFLDFPCFWQFWGILVRYFVECLSFEICFNCDTIHILKNSSH